MSAHKFKTISLFRDDQRPLEFKGFEVVAVEHTENMPVRRTRAAIYKTDKGQFVAEYAKWQGPEGNDKIKTAKVNWFDTLEGAAEWFRPGPVTVELLSRLKDQLEPERL